MKVHLPHEPLFDQKTLEKRIRELGAQITADYKGEEIVAVGVLKGSVIFMADLVRCIEAPIHMEFVGVSSYKGTESTGHVRITHDLDATIKGRHVLLIEDIIDTGLTIEYLIEMFQARNPKSLKICSLLSKPEAHIMSRDIDYVGFEISKEFVIGYGLDLDGLYRNLPDIVQVKSDS
ncbi:hypoxanthine phosphoribosyltransferase [Oligoflexaceae bacterium]|nr:hypoxanthine phosphoribosyltransferase [Oligoflexaceae bacterium]